MKFALILTASFFAVTLAGNIVADVVDVQPPDVYNTVIGSSGWLPANKVYSLANTSLGWVYWQADNTSGQLLCAPAEGWIAPRTAVNVSIRPAAWMAAARPGTYADRVTLNFDPRLVGDVNGDGAVDATDLLIMCAAFGANAGEPAYNVACDFGGDGSVDISDLLRLIGTFGMTYGSLVV
jgi:hypothetical protein